MTRRRKLLHYYRQFEALDPREDAQRLRAKRTIERSAELERIAELDLSRTDWHEPPDPEIVNAATFALRRAVNRYPPAGSGPAVQAVARRHNLPPERVALGHGAGELLQAALRELGTGGDVVLPWPSWAPLPGLIARTGARPVPVTLHRDGSADLDALAAAVTPATRAIVLCSPNDPTGTLVPRDGLRALAAASPDVTIVVDEALVELAGEDASAVGLTDELERLLVLRSFSKAWAMAGLRAGYVVGPVAAAPLLRVLSPGQGVASPTQAAVVAALEQPVRAAARLDARRRAITAERDRLAAALADTPFGFPLSETHTVWLGGGEHTAASLTHGLADQRVLVAPGTDWGDEAHVRITLRDRPATERLIRALHALVD